MEFPDYRHDLKKQLLKRLNHRGDSRYSIIKRMVDGKVQATVYYDFQDKKYCLGHFRFYGPYDADFRFIENRHNYAHETTAIQIKSAQSRFKKYFKELQIMYENDLL